MRLECTTIEQSGAITVTELRMLTHDRERMMADMTARAEDQEERYRILLQRRRLH
jgi:hypothetical protein